MHQAHGNNGKQVSFIYFFSAIAYFIHNASRVEFGDSEEYLMIPLRIEVIIPIVYKRPP
jgi:hypothetical protein